MIKNYFMVICLMALSSVIRGQMMEEYPKLKNIKVVKKFFRNSQNDETITKDIHFKDGKLTTVKTSDVVQNFFYNEKGLLNKTTKERVGSNWNEVTQYYYDPKDRLVEFSKKYQDGNEYVVKTVKFTYEGAHIKAEAKKSNSHNQLVEDIEYIVENGLIVRRVSRNRNNQIIGKTEYSYYNENVSRHTGLVGDKTIKMYTYDGKNSVNLLIVKSLFGANYKVITPLISFYDEEFDFQSISKNNELTFKATSQKYTPVTESFKYNASNYPVSSLRIDGDGFAKTESIYFYE